MMNDRIKASFLNELYSIEKSGGAVGTIMKWLGKPGRAGSLAKGSALVGGGALAASAGGQAVEDYQLGRAIRKRQEG